MVDTEDGVVLDEAEAVDLAVTLACLRILSAIIICFLASFHPLVWLPPDMTSDDDVSVLADRGLLLMLLPAAAIHSPAALFTSDFLRLSEVTAARTAAWTAASAAAGKDDEAEDSRLHIPLLISSL